MPKPLFELVEAARADTQLDALLRFRTTADHRTYGPYGYVDGSRLNQRTHDALTVAAYVSGWGPLVFTQGGLNGGLVATSARTHDGLDVGDVQTRGRKTADILHLADVALDCGAVMFIRGTPDDDISDGMVPHGHTVMIGAQHAHPDARSQIYSERYGYAHGGAGLGGAPGARWWGPKRRPLVEWADSKLNPANGWRP